MPTATCKCGKMTNSATSDYWDQYRAERGTVMTPTGLNIHTIIPTKCYAAFVDGKWVKGCSFDEADDVNKQFARDLIAKETRLRSGT